MHIHSFAEPQRGRITALAQASCGDFSHLESITTTQSFRTLRDRLEALMHSKSKEDRALFGIYELISQDEKILQFIVQG